MTDAPAGRGIQCNCGLWHPEMDGPRENCPVHGRKESDEARARLAAVIAECDRIEAALEHTDGGGQFWAAWARRNTAQRIRAIARGEDEYTPTTEDVRYGYAYSRVIHYYFDGGDAENAEGLREFDRWLATHDTQVRRKILDDIEPATHEAWYDDTSGVVRSGDHL